jgi:predicted nucleic acid-binding protein
MVTMDANAIFLDTNVLIYATDPRSPLQPIAERALQFARNKREQLVVSPQVLREYMAVALRPASAGGTSLEDVLANIAAFRAEFLVVDETSAVCDQLVTLLQRIPTGGRRIHDTNMVATMLAHGVRHLLTHNTADFERFGDLISVVPLSPP